MTVQNGALVAKVTAGASFFGTRVTSRGFPNHALNIKVELLLNTTWTDITQYVMVRDDISISPFGRTDESSAINSAQMTMTLKNIDGRFSPDNASGAYFPYIQLNTKIRLSVSDASATGVAYSGYRFWGEVSEWPPGWGPKGNDSYVTITASGIWRRLSQSTKTIGSPYTRFNNQLKDTYDLVGYWPMEDGQGSNFFATVIPGTSGNMTMPPPTNTNAPTLASIGGFPGSDALPTINRAELDATITTSSNPTTVQFRFLLFVPSGGDTGRPAGTIARLHTSGTVTTVDVKMGANATGPLQIVGSNSGGTTLFSDSSTLTTWGNPMMVIVDLTQQGSNILWTMNTITPGATTWQSTVRNTITGTVDDAISVIFNPGGTFSTVSVGQAAVYYGNPPIQNTSSALNAWTNENALTRFQRICGEEGIPFTSIGTTTTTMGPQVDDALVNVLQQIEDTDGGLLYETQSAFGLGYRTMASLQNQSVKLTMNYAAAQIGQPLTPVMDDALTRNDVTLTNYDGYAVRVYLANGARSIQDPPNGVGTGYEYTRNVSGRSQTQINNLGVQLLNCGTVAKSRYPNVTANLARTTTAPLFATVPSMRQGDYLQMTNMPAIGGSATQKQLVWGWTETINQFAWTFVFNTIPEDPWESSFNPGTSATGQVPATPTTVSSQGTVSSATIQEGAIIGANIAQGAVQGGNIATASITADNIAAATITGALIGTGEITGSNIASATIAGSNIEAGTITGGPGGNIASATITGSEIGSGTITGGAGGNIASATITGNEIHSATITGGSGGNLASATITATNIQNATITATQISGSAGITGSQLSSSAGITGGQIANATITNSQISATAGITGSKIASGSITATQIQSASITNVQIAAGSITGGTGGNIDSGTITADNIASSTITSVQIANGTITTTQISPTAGITGSQLSSTAGITAGQVAFTASAIGGLSATFASTAPSSPNTGDLWYDTSNGNELKRYNGTSFVAEQFGTNAIVAASVTTSLLAANAVTAAKIAAGTITATQISATAGITGNMIAANTITAGNIGAGQITATLMAANSIAAGSIQSGAVTAGKIDANAINGMTITGANLIADGASGQFLIYNGTPSGGNLVGSWSGVDGSDGLGNDFPAGLSVNQGLITGIGIDSVTITNATLQGDILTGSTLTEPAITGGSLTETTVTFDQSGGKLLVYTSTTTSVTLTPADNASSPWTVPAGVTSLQVECIGAGAGGDGGTTSAGGNGGGGAEYAAELTYAVSPAEAIDYNVGSGGIGNTTNGGHGSDGGDTFFDGNNIIAHGGNGDGTPGSGSHSSIHHNGGSGPSSGANAGGSSGGNSANINAAGNNGIAATSSTGAAAPSTQTGSGRGGAGGSSGANGSNATSPGGGGGGAGKGSTSSTKTVTYAPLYSGSYYGPDADASVNDTLRTTNVLYQGGETASGGAFNGNQRSIFGFNRTLIASDFSGFTITSCQLQLKNLHSYNSSGMSFTVDEYQGLPGTLPSTYPAGDYRSTDASGTIAEGDTHIYTLPASIAQRFATGSSNGLGLGATIHTIHPFNTSWYGYFDPDQIRFSITGTSGAAGSETAGNGGDGQIKITYTSGQIFAAAIAPVAGTDDGGNAFAAGYTGPVNVIQPGSSPSVVETWHNFGTSSGAGTFTGTARYKLMPGNCVRVHLVGNFSAAGTGSFPAIPSAYWPSATFNFPSIAANAANRAQLSSSGVLAVVVPSATSCSFCQDIPLD